MDIPPDLLFCFAENFSPPRSFEPNTPVHHVDSEQNSGEINHESEDWFQKWFQTATSEIISDSDNIQIGTNLSPKSPTPVPLEQSLPPIDSDSTSIAELPVITTDSPVSPSSSSIY